MNRATPTDTEVRQSGADQLTQTADDLPRETATPESERLDSEQALGPLLDLFQQPGPAIPEDAWPALMHGHRQLGQFRLDYPVLIPTTPGDSIVPLRLCIDRLIEQRVGPAGGDSDAARHLQQDLVRVEARIRQNLSGDDAMPALDEAWRAAGSEVLESFGSRSEEARQRIESTLEAALDDLPTDRKLLDCHHRTAAELTDCQFRNWWHQHTRDWCQELHRLNDGLRDLLRSETDRSQHGRSAAHLSQSVGTADAQDMDFDQLSDILERSHLDQPLPAERHARIESLLETLQTAAGALQAPFDVPQTISAPRLIRNDCARAESVANDNMRATIALFRDANIADLELRNRYRPTQHDAYFAQFGRGDLDSNSVRLCPPVVLLLDDGFDCESQLAELLSLLDGDLPVKVILQTSGLPWSSGWFARLAAMAAALHQPWVCQTSIANPTQLVDRLTRAFRYPGPALVTLVGPSDDATLPPYLQSAAALESRAAPAWHFDPLAGQGQAQQMGLDANPEPTGAWSRDEFEYIDGGGETRRDTMAFTPADLMACDLTQREHFRIIPPALWHTGMQALDVYLDAYLDANRTDSASHGVPYLRLVRPDGDVLRLLPDDHVLETVKRVARDWRALQEACGIDNSHARAALSAHAEELAAERDQGIDEVRRRYEQQLQLDVGQLSRSIVARIADQLLGTAESGPMPVDAEPAFSSAPAPPAGQAPGGAAPDSAGGQPEQPATDAADPAAESPPDDDFDLDDPYIDTPLCTTCDDCTKLNPSMFAYDENKQAYIKDASAGSFQDLVRAAEKCPVRIIHPGKPGNPDEPDLATWVERAKPFQ